MAYLNKDVQRKQLELDALIEITKALNQNLSDDELYRIFGFIIRTHLGIKKLALYSVYPSVICKFSWGLKPPFPSLSGISNLGIFKTPVRISAAERDPFLRQFDFIIPVFENNRLLTLLFIQEEKTKEKKNNVALNFVMTLSHILVTAVENKRLQTEQTEKKILEKELELAVQVQNALIPKNLPDTGRISAAARYIPHKNIGGDYYDFIPLSPNECIFCIADVSGKGVPAALIMAVFQATFRALIKQGLSLTDIVKSLNKTVFHQAEGDRFVSFFTAKLNLALSTLEYINAGHNPPLIFSGQSATELENGTTLLGIFEELPFIKVQSYTINPGEFLFLYTDGISEATNKKDEFFGTGNIKSVILQNIRNSPDAILGNLLRALSKFCGGKDIADDVAMLGIRVGK